MPRKGQNEKSFRLAKNIALVKQTGSGFHWNSFSQFPLSNRVLTGRYEKTSLRRSSNFPAILCVLNGSELTLSHLDGDG